MAAGNHLRANLALLLCSVIWGTTFVVVQNALKDSSVLMFLAVRFTSSALLIAIVYRNSLRGVKAEGIRSGVIVGLFMFGGYVFQTIGLKFTTASKAAFLTGSSVVLVPLLLVLCRQQRVTRWVWWGATTAFAGLYLLTVGGGGLHGLNKGDPLVFISAISFALQIIFIGRSVGHVSAGAIGFLEVATTALLSVTLVPIAAALDFEALRFTPTRELLIALAVTAIGGTVICLPLQAWAQQYASPSHAAIILSLEPVFAAITSYFVQAEKMGLPELFGATLILAGIVLVECRSTTAPAFDATPRAAPPVSQ